MKKILYIISMILLSAACTKGLTEGGEPAGAPLSVSIRIGTKAGNGDASAKPVVNSVRILAFAGAAGSEKCVLNQHSPFGFTLAEVSDVWTVQMKSNIVIESSATSYRLFAVLNEGDHIISAERTLTKALNDIDGQSTLSQFEALAATPVQYSPLIVTDNEPAFLMFARKDIQFTSGFDAPLDVVFDTEGTGTVAPKRGMAQIVIDKITSEPVADHTSGNNVPKIFIKNVSLVNVPAAAAWGSEGTLGTDPTSIQVGAANEETGCYDRTWEGSVSCNVIVNATRNQTTSAKYWRTGDMPNDVNKQSKTAWSFTAPTSFTYHFEPANANADKVREAQQKAYKYAYAGRTTIDEKYDTANDKKSVYDLVTSHLPGQFTPELVINTNFTTNSIVEGSATGTTVSPDYWTVRLNEGYYVPENIASDAAGATCIKVSLALAAPTLNADAVTVADLSSAPSEFISEPASGFIYTISDYDLTQQKINYKTGQKDKQGNPVIQKDKDKWVPIVFGDNAHIVYSDDHDYQVVKPDDEGDAWYDTHNNFHVYVDGFGRTVDGQAYVQVTNTTKNAVFAWNVPTTTVDLTIPVSDDFCVRRNTRYTITLHVDDSTYGKMTTTPSATSLTKSAPDLCGLTATVRIEKMNDDEE